MSDPVAAVMETEASGETAAIFADIRSVYGISVVNLIWRHLATFPGALPWAWGTVRPLYAGGAIAREAAGLRAARRLPSLPPIPREVFTAMGLTRDDLRQIGVVLDAYERTNPMALVALSVLRHSLDTPASFDAGAEIQTPRTEKSDPEPRLPPLPPLLQLDQMAPAVADLVLMLNRIGAAHSDPILASMYRNLAHWPRYLALAWMLLAPLRKAGGLTGAIRDIRAEAIARAREIAPRGPASVPALPVEQRAEVAAAIERFADDAICRMVVICGTLRNAGLDV